MKVLSLLQPWASAIVTEKSNCSPRRPVKEWETRSWKPSAAMQHILKTDGCLVHASKRWRNDQKLILDNWPFEDYLEAKQMITGALIGWVKFDKYMTSQEWKERTISDGASADGAEEFHMGDYSDNRWTWHISAFKLFPKPISATGQLGFWNFEFAGKEQYHILQCKACGYTGSNELFPVFKNGIDTEEENWEQSCPVCEEQDHELIIDNLI